VLTKPGPLEPEEWALIHRHPATGARMLSAPQLADIAAWIGCHHERPDGAGYPDGRDRIPLEAAIISACDAFDAMTSERPSSRAIARNAALDELHAHAGSQFDLRVVEALHAAVAQTARARVASLQ
jgi:HD-GYP domain-containing protein (c-di-GMP phosphodiesterase class II)